MGGRPMNDPGIYPPENLMRAMLCVLCFWVIVFFAFFSF